jgi:hypothetical protein
MTKLPLAVTVSARPSPISAELPAEYIRELKARLIERERLLAELPALIEQDRKLYEAALLFAPDGFDPAVTAPTAETPSEAPERQLNLPAIKPPAKRIVIKRVPAKTKRAKVVKKKQASWKTLVVQEAEGAERGLSHKSLLSAIRAKHAMPVSAGEKGFYNAVAKSIHDGSLVKRGGLLFSPRVVLLLERRGEKLPEDGQVVHRAGGSALVTQRVLAQHPEGLTGPALKKLVAAEPDAPKSMREHGQYIYNILGTLMGSGAVVKKENLYYLVQAQGGGSEK